MRESLVRLHCKTFVVLSPLLVVLLTGSLDRFSLLCRRSLDDQVSLSIAFFIRENLARKCSSCRFTTDSLTTDVVFQAFDAATKRRHNSNNLLYDISSEKENSRKSHAEETGRIAWMSSWIERPKLSVVSYPHDDRFLQSLSVFVCCSFWSSNKNANAFNWKSRSLTFLLWSFSILA